MAFQPGGEHARTTTDGDGAGHTHAGGTDDITVRPAWGRCASACPSAPRNLVVTIAAHTVTMQWSAPASGVPTSYIIEASSTPGGPANLANFHTGNTALSLVTADVASGSYYVRIRAVNSCGTNPVSNEVALVVP